MARETNGKGHAGSNDLLGYDDPQAVVQDGGTNIGDSAPLDVEAAKRNLQALVAAGMHAHGLLGHDDANAGEYMSDEDGGDQSSSDGSDRNASDGETLSDEDDEEEEEDEVEEKVASGQVARRPIAQQHDAYQTGGAMYDYAGGGGGGGAVSALESAGGSILDMHPSGAEYYFGGSDFPGSHAQAGGDAPADDEESHQALLSRVASNFRALIGHGLTAAGGGADGADGYGDSAPLDDGEAYELACATLEGNLRYQRLLRTQLAAIDAAQRRNKELQESIGALLTIQARATNRRSGRRNKDERSSQVDPVTNELKIAASSFFVDSDGGRAADNRDTVRKKKHPPIVYRARRWTDAEREALVRGVRQCNRKLMLQKLYQQNTDPRTIWNADKVSDQELEMNLMGVDWKFIAKQFVPQHKPVECAIQYATQDHPIINREPWTKREERALHDAVQAHGGRDWVSIAKALDTQRTAAQCFQVYQRKLNPDMSRSKWTPEEDQLLHEAVMTYGEGDWQAVASCLDNRTGQQVLHRWCKSINPAIRSGRWDKDEDVALLAAVRLYGVGQWTKIAKHVPGRTDVKCRERYMNVLTPDVNNAQWTAAEDARLVAIVSRVGIGKWSYVADLLGNRTDNQCWRHWRSLHKKGKAPAPPADPEGEHGEEGTVPSFPEWEAERRRRQRDDAPGAADADADADALLSFAHTQGNGRKRKTTSGIESARKRQWKRATSTNFVPLLPPVPQPAERQLDAEPSPSRQPRSAKAADVARVGRPSRSRLSLPAADEQSEPAASSPAARRSSAMRRGRVLNWVNILHAGAEAKGASDGVDARDSRDPRDPRDPSDARDASSAHLRPVLPCLGTVQGLQRLLEAVPDASAAFNAELLGIDDDESAPSLDSVAVNWLRQRIEALFIWPLMLGTLDIQGNRK